MSAAPPASIVGYVQTCVAVDATTGECTVTAWMPAGPALTIPEAQQIAVAIAALWATAWVFKMLKRTVQQD